MQSCITTTKKKKKKKKKEEEKKKKEEEKKKDKQNVTTVKIPCPAEPGYTLPLQTVQVQISWLLKKPNDLELHCLSFSM